MMPGYIPNLQFDNQRNVLLPFPSPLANHKLRITNHSGVTRHRDLHHERCTFLFLREALCVRIFS